VCCVMEPLIERGGHDSSVIVVITMESFCKKQAGGGGQGRMLARRRLSRCLAPPSEMQRPAAREKKKRKGVTKNTEKAVLHPVCRSPLEKANPPGALPESRWVLQLGPLPSKIEHSRGSNLIVGQNRGNPVIPPHHSH
jgi:hypothetical protein